MDDSRGVAATTPISAEKPDWTREEVRQFWDPSRQLLSAIRKYQLCRGRPGIRARLISKACALRHRFWSAVTGADIPLNCNIGGGLLIPHPNGIVIHPDAVIGVNCLIFQQVTVGTRSGWEGAPRIGGHVDVGAGSKILGPVHIGPHAQIGANAVVLVDVPEGACAVGVPARNLTVRASLIRANEG